MKNLKWLLLLLVATGLTIASGYVDAYMRKETEEIQNIFVPAQVDCLVDEDVVDNKKTSVTAINTSNVNAYIRMRSVSYWLDENGDITYYPSPTNYIDYNDINATDWIVDTANNTFYYKYPVGTAETAKETKNLLKIGESIVLKTEDGRKQVIEFFAEAIQADPAQAVIDAWGATVDTDGTITKIN